MKHLPGSTRVDAFWSRESSFRKSFAKKDQVLSQPDLEIPRRRIPLPVFYSARNRRVRDLAKENGSNGNSQSDKVDAMEMEDIKSLVTDFSASNPPVPGQKRVRIGNNAGSLRNKTAHQ